MKRHVPLTRRARLRAVNPGRKQSEFRRTYHSRERVRFVKSLPCVVCQSLSPFLGGQTVGKCDNAHVGGNGGAGRKGPYTEIAPLCRAHHRRFDEHKPPFDREAARAAMLAYAAKVEAGWQAYSSEQSQSPYRAARRRSAGG